MIVDFIGVAAFGIIYKQRLKGSLSFIANRFI
jgi:hypothetical protein